MGQDYRAQFDAWRRSNQGDDRISKVVGDGKEDPRVQSILAKYEGLPQKVGRRPKVISTVGRMGPSKLYFADPLAGGRLTEMTKPGQHLQHHDQAKGMIRQRGAELKQLKATMAEEDKEREKTNRLRAALGAAYGIEPHVAEGVPDAAIPGVFRAEKDRRAVEEEKAERAKVRAFIEEKFPHLKGMIPDDASMGTMDMIMDEAQSQEKTRAEQAERAAMADDLRKLEAGEMSQLEFDARWSTAQQGSTNWEERKKAEQDEAKAIEAQEKKDQVKADTDFRNKTQALNTFATKASSLIADASKVMAEFESTANPDDETAVNADAVRKTAWTRQNNKTKVLGLQRVIRELGALGATNAIGRDQVMTKAELDDIILAVDQVIQEKQGGQKFSRGQVGAASKSGSAPAKAPEFAKVIYGGKVDLESEHLGDQIDSFLRILGWTVNNFARGKMSE